MIHHCPSIPPLPVSNSQHTVIRPSSPFPRHRAIIVRCSLSLRIWWAGSLACSFCYSPDRIAIYASMHSNPCSFLGLSISLIYSCLPLLAGGVSCHSQALGPLL